MATPLPDISAADFFPAIITLDNLRVASENCKGCHLYLNATQTVFGEGPPKASLIVVGEMAGEKEDEIGRPFVGPAGKLLRQSIETSGLDEKDIYFTNVVKHFKYTYMNKRKLHRSPGGKEIRACKPWLEAEIDVIQPKAIICLGSIAAKALMNKQFLIRKQRGQWFEFRNHTKILATFHPSAILRTIDRESRHEMRNNLVSDLKKVATYLVHSQT